MNKQLIVDLEHSKVIVGVCSRNIIRYLLKFHTNINRLISVFKSYRIVIGESDSSDGTLGYLKNWFLSDPSVTVHTFSHPTRDSEQYHSHTRRLGYCRSFLLNKARTEHQLEQARFYLVADPDVNANDILSLETFLSNFEYD